MLLHHPKKGLNRANTKVPQIFVKRTRVFVNEIKIKELYLEDGTIADDFKIELEELNKI